MALLRTIPVLALVVGCVDPAVSSDARSRGMRPRCPSGVKPAAEGCRGRCLLENASDFVIEGATADRATLVVTYSDQLTERFVTVRTEGAWWLDLPI